MAAHESTKSRKGHLATIPGQGVDAPGAGQGELHDLIVTKEYHDALPEA